MSSYHDRPSDSSHTEHRQEGHESRSAPRPYEWYDLDQSIELSRQQDPYYRNSSGDGYQQWPQYGYDDQVYEQYQNGYSAINEQSSMHDEGKPTATNKTDKGKKKQPDKISGTKSLPHRSVSSSSKNSQARWHLSKEFQAFVQNSRTDTLLLLDDYCRPLSASKELYAFLQSLPSSSDDKGLIRGVITASKNGRWLALVACNDPDTAKALSIEIKNRARNIEAKFVTNQVFNHLCQSQKLVLAEGLRQRFSEEGVLLDEWSSLATFEPVKLNWKDKDNDQQFTLPGNVSRDHRNITSANPLSFAKKAASHISRWNAQQEELQRNDVAENSAISNLQHPNSKPSNDIQTSEDFNYLDEEKKACLLCQRQFKALEVLKRHSVESELHKKNLQDKDRCIEGKKRKTSSTAVVEGTGSASSTGMKKAGFAPVQIGTTLDNRHDSSSEDNSMQYRDRAAERRIVFGTEAIAKAKVIAKKRPYSGDSMVKDSPSVKLDETSIGGVLLAKMGWTSGKGLGVNGEGRTNPILTHVYTPGAGIGSQGNTNFAPTVEEYSSRQTKFIQGGKAYQKSARMQERYNT